MIMSQWVTQRDPRFWRDPSSFDPGRWGENAARPKYAYFPHGGGPRFCMGDSFAEMLSIIVIAMTARRFRLFPVSDAPVKLMPSYALFPAEKVELRVQLFREKRGDRSFITDPVDHVLPRNTPRGKGGGNDRQKDNYRDGRKHNPNGED